MRRPIETTRITGNLSFRACGPRKPNFAAINATTHRMTYNLAVPKKLNPTPRQFKVGDRVKVSLPLGHIVDATIRAVIEHTDSIKLQVDYGKDQTALVSARQIVAG